MTSDLPHPTCDPDDALLDAVRQGDAAAWEQLIERHQRILAAWFSARIADSSQVDDLIQETFLGLLTSLPNYRTGTPLKAFLFSIASHKLIDLLRRNKRRPMFRDVASDSLPEIVGASRRASSMLRSRERDDMTRDVLGRTLRVLSQRWLARGEFERLKCAELLLGRGWANQRVAETLQISSHAVSNHKAFILGKLHEAAQQAGLTDLPTGMPSQ